VTETSPGNQDATPEAPPENQNGTPPAPPQQQDTSDFYWQQARDSLLTPVAIQMFQIADKHDGEDFDSAKDQIDAEYATLTGRESERHGGKFQTAVQVYQEAGWISLVDGKLTITDAGKQALALLGEVPDFLKAAPYFVVELLARFQINNPARPPVRNDAIAELRKMSDIFPYWTIWKIMRECENKIASEELKRFVFRLHRSEDIPSTIESIREFRQDKATLSDAEIEAKYPAPLEGASAEPKYWMGRAGAHVGKHPPLIEKPDASTYVLNEDYLPLIDAVLANEPIFKEHLSEDTWMAEHGKPIPISLETPTPPGPQTLEIDDRLEDVDPILQEIQLLISEGSRSFLLSGPPGTSKSWYARQLANRILGGDLSRVRLVQFHPSYAYEDFIEGFVPQVPEGGGFPTFSREWKVFAEVCDVARDGNYAVLIIDEFSRGDAGRIFGEALTYIEPDYRDTPVKLASGRFLSVPSQLVIIATMNPYDRSVTAVDVAMQRRFDILPMVPDERILRRILADNGMEEALVTKVVAFFQACQRELPHGGLGHTYFLKAKDVPTLQRIWRYNIQPLITQELQFDQAAKGRLETAYRAMVEGE
jgi:5-methylcytosine-specific restriction protein B